MISMVVVCGCARSNACLASVARVLTADNADVSYAGDGQLLSAALATIRVSSLRRSVRDVGTQETCADSLVLL